MFPHQVREELDAARFKLSAARVNAAERERPPTETEELLGAHDKVAVAQARLEVKRSTGHTHTHRQRTTPPTPTHTHTTRTTPQTPKRTPHTNT